MSEHASHPWAPKAGPRFFFLWMAGAVFAQMGHSTIGEFWLPGRNPGVGFGRWYNPVALAATVWCGWLIFRWNWRTFAWAAPTAALSLVTSSAISEYGLGFLVVLISIPFVQYLTLRGVRQRAALWFVVIYVELIYTILTTQLLDARVFIQMDQALASRFSVWIPLSISGSVTSGASIFASTIGGAALAWLMKPIEKPETALHEPTRPPRP